MVRFMRVSRNGNSLAVSIPAVLLAELQWAHGDVLAAGVHDGALIVRRQDEAALLRAPSPPRTVRVRRRSAR